MDITASSEASLDTLETQIPQFSASPNLLLGISFLDQGFSLSTKYFDILSFDFNETMQNTFW